MRSLLIAISLIAVSATSSFADPYADRSAIMKSIGKAVGSVAGIAKGDEPFDAAAVAAGLTAINDAALKIDVVALFPAGSDTGKSSASPKIWEDFAGFTAAMDKFKSATAAGVATPPADLVAFQKQFGEITENCGACHSVYRAKKG